MKQIEDIESLIDRLNKVEQIEPSPFMFAKIKHKIEMQNKTSEEFNTKYVLATSFALLLIVFMNITIIFYFSEQSQTDVQVNTIAETEQYVATTDQYYYNY